MTQLAAPNLLFAISQVYAHWPADAHAGRAVLYCEELTAAPQFHEIRISATFTVAVNTALYMAPMAPPPPGTYRVNCILFFRGEGDRPFYRLHPPYDFKPVYFECSPQMVSVRADGPECESRRQSMLEQMRIGEPGPDAQFHDVTYICRDALISTGARIGPAEVRPIGAHGIEDLANAMGQATLQVGYHDAQPAVVAEHINRAPDRRSPLFIVRFPRVYLPTERLYIELIPYLRRVLGILSLNRSSYGTVIGGISVQRTPGTTTYHYFNLNSYYRGNLATGPIARERADLWTIEYAAAASDPLKSDVLHKLNAAHAETDLDTAYFRLWSVLEAVAQDVRSSKHLDQVRAIIDAAYLPEQASNAVKLTFHAESFTFNQLLQMWHSWRNLTAHHGGIVAYRSGLIPEPRQERGLRRYIAQFAANNVVLDFGEDTVLLELQEVTRRVVRGYLAGLL